MATQHIKFKLTPGQMAPTGSTGISLSDGYIVWLGETGTFNDRAYFGRLGPQDPQPETDIVYSIMIQEEVDEYETILEAPAEEE